MSHHIGMGCILNPQTKSAHETSFGWSPGVGREGKDQNHLISSYLFSSVPSPLLSLPLPSAGRDTQSGDPRFLHTHTYAGKIDIDASMGSEFERW